MASGKGGKGGAIPATGFPPHPSFSPLRTPTTPLAPPGLPVIGQTGEPAVPTQFGYVSPSPAAGGCGK